MNDNEKLARLKLLLGITDTSSDTLLTGYLTVSKEEILSWLYSIVEQPSTVTDVPSKYENVQIMSCIAGFNLSGAENQTAHSENGIGRTFKYSDMLDYIHSHVYPYAGIEE